MGYRTLLAVVNEHTSSVVAARYTLAMATACKARLILYAIHDEGSSEAVLQRTERHLDHLFAAAFELDLPVTRITEVGMITRLLSKRAQAEEADLIFYPLPPSERYGAALQKDTVHRLLHTIRSDLAIMRIVQMAKPHPRHILAALGGIITDLEHRAGFLAALAKGFHSQITLFHRPDDQLAAPPGDVTRLHNLLRQYHQPVLERTRTGHIAKAIAMEAISHHHDLIVVGASERGTLRRLFWGNPAGDVMLQPPCNAILFRSAREK
ncbi:MAG: universal stress protein [Geobacter sp.]|nr:universal stress protein [Geobacter sp.]